jgi:hypothetical protein
VRTPPLWQWRIRRWNEALAFSRKEMHAPTAERVSNCFQVRRQNRREGGGGGTHIAHSRRGRGGGEGRSRAQGDLVHFEFALLIVTPVLVLLLILGSWAGGGREDSVLHEAGHVGENLCGDLDHIEVL